MKAEMITVSGRDVLLNLCLNTDKDFASRVVIFRVQETHWTIG